MLTLCFVFCSIFSAPGHRLRWRSPAFGGEAGCLFPWAGRARCGGQPGCTLLVGLIGWYRRAYICRLSSHSRGGGLSLSGEIILLFGAPRTTTSGQPPQQ